MEVQAVRERLEDEQRRLESLLARHRAMESQSAGFSELSLVDQHPAEIATETFELEKEVTIHEMLDGQLAEVHDALRKLEEGTYGVCEACGRPIPAARLEAKPSARFCLEDQIRAEREVNERRQLH